MRSQPHRSFASAALFVSITFASGCMTARTYDGEARTSDEIAHIAGDSPLSSAPLNLVLRKVDDQALSVSQSAVDVLPGKHTLLVDCRIPETKSVTRHSLEVEVFEGRRYRLVADTGPGMRGCTAVRLEGDY